MKILFITTLLFGCFFFSLAQVAPTFPEAMSATLFIRKHGDETNENWNKYYRWFHDLNTQVIRIDGGIEWKGDSVWMQSVIDLKEKHHYTVLFHDWLTAACYEGATNWTFTVPDFSDWTFVGNSVVGFRDTDHWIAPKFENEKLIHYWVTTDTKEPRQVELLDCEGNLWSITFVEVNVAPQSPHLFKLPDALEGKCNPLSKINF